MFGHCMLLCDQAKAVDDMQMLNARRSNAGRLLDDEEDTWKEESKVKNGRMVCKSMSNRILLFSLNR